MRISPTSSRNSLGFTLTETLLALAVCALAGFGALHAALVATRMEGQSAHAAADLDQFDRDWAARRGGWAGEGTDELMWVDHPTETEEMRWRTVTVLQTNGTRVIGWSSPVALPPASKNR